ARTITVTTSNLLPSASITSPRDGATFSWHHTITIDATASDSDGSRQKVEFFRDNGVTKLGEDTSAPYSYRWKNVPSGTQRLVVKATDNRGAVGPASAPVTITVRSK